MVTLKSKDDLGRMASDWISERESSDSYIDTANKFVKESLTELLSQVQRETLDYYEALSKEIKRDYGCLDTESADLDD